MHLVAHSLIYKRVKSLAHLHALGSFTSVLRSGLYKRFVRYNQETALIQHKIYIVLPKLTQNLFHIVFTFEAYQFHILLLPLSIELYLIAFF